MAGQDRVLELLRRRYARHDLRYVCAEDVAAPGSRVADFLAIDTGHPGEIIGHEILNSRRDWIVEMCNVGNSAFWRGFCHEWIVVAADESIVDCDELPDGWGLMAVMPHGLRLVQPPASIEHPRPVDAVTMSLIRQAAADTPQTATLRRAG